MPALWEVIHKFSPSSFSITSGTNYHHILFLLVSETLARFPTRKLRVEGRSWLHNSRAPRGRASWPVWMTHVDSRLKGTSSPSPAPFQPVCHHCQWWGPKGPSTGVRGKSGLRSHVLTGWPQLTPGGQRNSLPSVAFMPLIKSQGGSGGKTQWGGKEPGEQTWHCKELGGQQQRGEGDPSDLLHSGNLPSKTIRQTPWEAKPSPRVQRPSFSPPWTLLWFSLSLPPA